MLNCVRRRAVAPDRRRNWARDDMILGNSGELDAVDVGEGRKDDRIKW